MSFVDLDNLDHDSDLAAALGNMMIAWARAETAMVKAWAMVTDMHYNLAAAVYYNIPTFDSRTKALLAMIDDKVDPFPKRDALRDAVNAVSHLSRTRNSWVHGLWVLDTNTSVAHFFNMKQKSATRRATPVTANAVRQHASAVRDRARALAALTPVNIALHTSP